MEQPNIQQVLNLLLTLVILPSIPILAKYAVDALKAWVAEKSASMENKKVANYINEITDTVSQVVMYTTQTYVDTLKAQGKFDDEAQDIAFNKSKDMALKLLTAEAKAFIVEHFGDLDMWLDTKIEQTVKSQKLLPQA